MGNSVLVIEHNLDVIKSSDHIIDIGPDGGNAGGTIVAIGTPEEVAMSKKILYWDLAEEDGDLKLLLYKID